MLFCWHETRTPYPLLDLWYLRVPQFLTANVVAFCAYFATFAVFFFTALYLAEVAGYSGYRIALIFLPMTALMTMTSLLAVRWTSAIAARWTVFAGCVVFSAGLLLTAVIISPDPGFPQLAAALALTGIGIGATVVPITASALSAMPPERSGMAASAANTSREIGAVVGVAVLGALVNSQLHADLISRLHQLGIPANFQSIVINAIETGTVPPAARRKARARARARKSSCRMSSTPPTARTTRACAPRCSCRRHSSLQPGCLLCSQPGSAGRASRCDRGGSHGRVLQALCSRAVVLRERVDLDDLRRDRRYRRRHPAIRVRDLDGGDHRPVADPGPAIRAVARPPGKPRPQKGQQPASDRWEAR